MPTYAKAEQPAAWDQNPYEELRGGVGKDVLLRESRSEVAKVLADLERIPHYVTCTTCRGTLVNFTTNGLAFALSADASLPDNSVLRDFRVVVDDVTLYEGSALVRYCRPDGSGFLVGVALLDGILSTPQVLDVISRANLRERTMGVTRTVRSAIDPEYRGAIADLVYTLGSYKALLDEQDRKLQALIPEERRDREGDLLAAVERECSAVYDGFRRRLNALTARLSPTERTEYKRYTEATLHPLLLCAPLPHRCYAKPLGYPGDYALMSYVYSDARHGDSLYAKLIHQVTVRDEPMARAICYRRDLLISFIKSTLHAQSLQGPCRIMSVACGPAQEVVDFLRQAGPGAAPDVSSPAPATVVFGLSKPLEVTLVDQDQRALTHAHTSLSTLVIPHRSPVAIRYLYIGFMPLITDSRIFDSVPEQDLIYSAGLFDYLRPRIARKLLARLYSKLRLGGRVLIGNYGAPNDARWCMDYWMDWPLVYRTKDELLSLAADLPSDAHVQLTAEQSGYNYFLVATRG